MLSRCLSTKISASTLRWKFVKSALLVGEGEQKKNNGQESPFRQATRTREGGAWSRAATKHGCKNGFFKFLFLSPKSKKTCFFFVPSPPLKKNNWAGGRYKNLALTMWWLCLPALWCVEWRGQILIGASYLNWFFFVPKPICIHQPLFHIPSFLVDEKVGKKSHEKYLTFTPPLPIPVLNKLSRIIWEVVVRRLFFFFFFFREWWCISQDERGGRGKYNLCM